MFRPAIDLQGTQITLLPDGRLLLGLAEALYSIEDDTVTWLSHPHGRFFGTSTLLADGNSVLITGGGFDPSRMACIFHVDRPLDGCVGVAPMLGARTNHAATLLADGRVVVAGGYCECGDGSEQPVPRMEVYDPAEDRWTALRIDGKEPPTTIVAPHTLVRLQDGRIFTARGNLGGIWDPTTDDWFNISPPPKIGDSPSDALGSADALADGRILLVGVFNEWSPADQWKTSSIFDPSENRWSPIGELPISLVPYVVHDFGCGRILAIGNGLDGDADVNRMALTYAPSANQWYRVDNPIRALSDDTRGVVLRDGRIVLSLASFSDDAHLRIVVVSP